MSAVGCSEPFANIAEGPLSAPKAAVQPIANPRRSRPAKALPSRVEGRGGWLTAYAAVLQGSGERVHCPHSRPGLHNADVGRASQVQHAVEHMDGDVHLGGPTLICVGA